MSVLEYCLEKSSIVLELPRGWKVVQLISLEVEIIWKCGCKISLHMELPPILRLSCRLWLRVNLGSASVLKKSTDGCSLVAPEPWND
jgi:hypothetical protein